MIARRRKTAVQSESVIPLENLYRESFAEVHSLLCRVLDDADRALELAQECFLACLRKREFDRLPRQEMRLYLFGVARNLVKREKYRAWIRFRFQNSAAESLKVEWAAQSPADRLYRHELSKVVQAAVGALPDSLRWAVVLREYQECSYQEISEILEIPIGTVRSRLHSARRILAERLRPVVGNTGN